MSLTHTDLSSCLKGETSLSPQTICLGFYRRATANDNFNRILIKTANKKAEPFLTSPKAAIDQGWITALCSDCPLLR